MRRIVAALLAAVLTLSLAACGKGDGDGGADGKVDSLAYDGLTDYSVLISPDAGNMTLLAAQDFADYFKRATSAEITVESGERNFTEESRYISIGDNSLSRSAGLSESGADQGDQGFHIETKGKSLFVCGGGDAGNYYGTYDLMNKLFKFEPYAADTIYYEETLRLGLPKLNYSEKPDFESRVIYTFAMNNDRGFAQKMRTHVWESVWTRLGGSHSTFRLIGANDALRKEHPDWFARKLDENGNIVATYNQLCFTNEEVIAALTEAVLKEVDGTPEAKSVAVCIEDNRSVCLCPECQKVAAQYGGSNAAAVIHALNRISAAIDQHLEETGQDRTVKAIMFGYYGYLDAPVTDNGDGTFSPIDDSVVLSDHCGVMIAPIDTDYAHSYYETGFNAAETRAFEQWSSISKTIYVWGYSTDFKHYLVPFDAFNSMQENFQYMREHNVSYIYAQGNFGSRGTGFIDLQNYLEAKFMWDADEDFDTLVDNFFNAVFREAAPAMRKYFDELRDHFAYLRKEQGLTGWIYYESENKNLWPYSLLQQWSGYIDDAYKAIAKYKKSDPELYAAIEEHITVESIAIRHLIATLYKGMYNDADYRDFVTALKDDMSRTNVTRYSEGSAELPY